MDGDFELAEHLFLGQLADDMLGDEFVLQTVVDEVLGVDTLVDEASHLVNHSLVEAGTQAAADAFATGVTVHFHTDDQGILHGMRLGEGFELGMQLVVSADLDGACGTCHGVDVAVVAQSLHRLEHSGQFLERLTRQFSAQRLVAGHGRQFDALDDSLDIHPRAATHDDGFATATNVIVNPFKILKELIKAVAVARRTDVDEVIGHTVVLGQVLARADVHAAVNLARIGTDDLSADRLGQMHRPRRLTRRRRPRHHKKHILIVHFFYWKR